MRRVLAFLLLLPLVGCGGDGGSGPPPKPQNQPPALTSAPSVTAQENATGSVYQATASDPDGNAVTFTIGGADAARFVITGAGALSFVAPPDFEAPADGDKNNIYELELVANDGLTTSRMMLKVTVTNTVEGFKVERVGYLYEDPVQVVAVPGSRQVFVAERFGRISLLDATNPDPGAPQGLTYLRIPDVGIFGNEAAERYGILSMAAAQDYLTSGIIYIALTNSSGDIEIRRYTRSNPAAGDPNSVDVILRIPNVPEAGDRLGGWIGFGPDGFLYMTTGHGGTPGNAQDPSTLLGKVLRIDLSRDAFPQDPNRDYAIPVDNPALGGRVSEVYALGLGDPWRASFNDANLFIGDRADGQTWQEVNLLRPQDKGANFGYPSSDAGTLPVLRHGPARISTVGKVTGGFVYSGTAPGLRGLYIFADAIRRSIWSVPASALSQGSTIEESGYTLRSDLLPQDGYSADIVSFGEDADRNLYMVQRMNGIVYKVATF